MEYLLLVGLTLFVGTFGGKLCQRFKIPQVTGYILVGLLLGHHALNIWPGEAVKSFAPMMNLALGVIGFMIGSELKMDVFRKRGRSIYAILFSETLMTFFLVFLVVTLISGKYYLGILFGALAAATAPAATVDVLWENKTRGPLTATLLAIVALDDVLALILYGFASVIAKSLITHEHLSLLHAIEAPFLEIGVSIVIGLIGAYLLYGVTRFVRDRERVLPFAFGVLLLTIGAALHFHVDLILSSMILGFVLINISPAESQEIFASIKKISAPIYVLFFVLVGAQLNFALFFQAGIGILAAGYILSRTFGKMIGAFLGGWLGKAPKTVTKYLGLCLFSQAGVAIGMAFSIAHNLSRVDAAAADIGLMIVNVVVATTFVVQLVGPLCVRFAVSKAGEIGKDVTEADVIDSYCVGDMIEKDVPIIKEDMCLQAMVDLVKESESHDFCVVDHQGCLKGSISIGDLRDVLMDQPMELNNLILSKDIAVPAAKVIAKDRPLKEAIEILRRKEMDFLPVVVDEKTKELAGLIHYREVMTMIQREVLRRRGDHEESSKAFSG